MGIKLTMSDESMNGLIQSFTMNVPLADREPERFRGLVEMFFTKHIDRDFPSEMGLARAWTLMEFLKLAGYKIVETDDVADKMIANLSP